MRPIREFPLAVLMIVSLAAPASSLVFKGQLAQERPEPTRNDITKRLEDLLAGKRQTTDLRIDVEWLGRSARIHGTGVGIWNNQKQFSLSRNDILDFLRALEKARFGSMQMADPEGKSRHDKPERIIGGITLTIGDVAKSVSAQGGEEDPRELAELAKEILDRCEKAAQRGVTATTLTEGLQKILKHKLAPEAMEIVVHRVAENPPDRAGPAGWLLRLSGRTAVTRRQSKDRGYGPPRRLLLSRPQLENLLKLLIDGDVENLPINVYAPYYTDFSITVLDHERNVQARPFTGMTPTTHGAKQKAFDRIYDGLSGLEQVIQRQGKAEQERK